MKRLLHLSAAVAIIAGVVSCSTTGLGRSWAAPDAQGTTFSKLAVVALTRQEVYRVEAEDALVAEMTNGVASHTILPGLNQLNDTAAALTAIRGAGCDGLVVLRLKSGPVKPDPNAGAVTTGSAGADMNDYWSAGATQAESFAPGQYFAVDVRLFDLRKNKLVWSGLAVEQNARDAGDLVRKVRADVIQDLRQRGLVAR